MAKKDINKRIPLRQGSAGRRKSIKGRVKSALKKFKIIKNNHGTAGSKN
jgi:hypothetical protein